MADAFSLTASPSQGSRMCLIVFAWQPGHALPLLVAANRDEFYARPSLPLAAWEDAEGVFAGRDLEAGGTWLGLGPAGLRRPDQRPRSVAGSRQALPWRTGGGLPARRRQPGRLPGAGRRARRGLFRLQPAHWRSPSALALQPPRRATAPAAGGDLRAVQRGPRYALAEAAQGSRRPRRAACRAASAGPAGAAGRRSAGRRRPVAGYQRGSGHGTPALQRVHRQPELRHSRQQRRTGTRRRHAGDDRAQLRAVRRPARRGQPGAAARLTFSNRPRNRDAAWPDRGRRPPGTAAGRGSRHHSARRRQSWRSTARPSRRTASEPAGVGVRPRPPRPPGRFPGAAG
ncbi:hypothetical protein CF510_22674 [Pseudomonas aeruginosa PADK2_CF510]|nr:hypothetical protein CF510_22674 [Pseudomonas aeruginosa PADK2_CF510]